MTGRGWEMRHGDSLRILRELEADSVDGMIADPPYSSGGLFRGDRAASTGQKYVQTETLRSNKGEAAFADFEGDFRDQCAQYCWLRDWLLESERVLKAGAVVAVFTDWRQLSITADALRVAGFFFRGVVVWDKGEGSRPQLGRPRAQSEFVIWGSRGMLDDKARHVWAGCPPGVLQARVDTKDKYHQAGKPVSLLRELVKWVCPPGGLLLDPFAGSATAGVAALLEGRRYLGIEKAEHYFETSVDRLAAADVGSTLSAARSGQSSFLEPAEFAAGLERVARAAKEAGG